MGNLEDKKAKGPVKDKTAEVASKGRKRPIRVTRDLLVKKGPLQVPESVKKPGMVYFWMKDGPYQFENYSRLGYDFVTDDKGNNISIGRQGETMFLLEIPKDLHDELRALKAELKAERTDAIHGIKSPRTSGQVEGIFEEKLTIK